MFHKTTSQTCWPLQSRYAKPNKIVCAFIPIEVYEESISHPIQCSAFIIMVLHVPTLGWCRPDTSSQDFPACFQISVHLSCYMEGKAHRSNVVWIRDQIQWLIILRGLNVSTATSMSSSLLHVHLGYGTKPVVQCLVNVALLQTFLPTTVSAISRSLQKNLWLRNLS